MEIRVASAAGHTVPPGCYVGVRVGEVLKQGRYEPQRCYHFPAVERRRNAKIDIYRHIGSCVVPVDPSAGSRQEISVASTDPTLPEMKLNVNVDSAGSVDLTKQKREDKTKMITSQAKDYLGKYDIEEKLSLAVKALLREQPADPTAFLCRYLQELETSFKPTAREIKDEVPVPEGSKPAGPVSLKDGKFADYYKATCLPSAGSEQSLNFLYSKFPAAEGRLAPSKSKAVKVVDGKDAMEQLRKQSRDALLKASSGGQLKSALQDALAADDSEGKACVMGTRMLMGPQFYSLGMPNTLRVI